MNTTAPDPIPETAHDTAEPRRVLPATIVWGCILLAIAALYGVRVAGELDLVQFELRPAWVALGIGAILVVGGLAAAVSRRR